MELLETAILNKGKVLEGNILKVDNFLNHRIDVDLLSKMGEFVYEHFKTASVTEILTVEASGIAFACLCAEHFHCPVLFAKKSRSKNLGAGVYTAEAKSYTHGTVNNLMVSSDYIGKNDRVLIVDDFLATGEAAFALKSIVEQSGATLVGFVSAIEKGYQGGGDKLRSQGVDVLSLAIVDEMDVEHVKFRK